MSSVTIISKRPYYYPAEERDEEGNIITPGVYNCLGVRADVVVPFGNYNSEFFVPVQEDATDAEITTAILAQFGIEG
jgi:hypothetical protein